MTRTGPQVEDVKLSAHDPSYTGVEILETLTDAVNYNGLLTGLIEKAAEGKRAMIDFGAGIGTFSKELRERGVTVTCIEPDAVLAQNLARQGFDTHHDLETIPDHSAPAIFSLNVVEHIEDDAGAVQVLSQKLKAGGRLLIYVPAFRCLWTSLDDKVKHFRRYRRHNLEELVRSAGLIVRESQYVDSLGFLAALIFKLGGNKEGHLQPKWIRRYDRYVIPVSMRLDRLFGGFFGKNVYVICEKIS